MDAQKIDIVIISYNRPKDLLELLRNIAALENRHKLQDVIVVNNLSTESYEDVESFIRDRRDVPFKYVVAEKNLGVSGGRNLAITLSTAPVLVFLDDDALFESADALNQVEQIFSPAPGPTRPVGIVAFKVLYHSTGTMQVTAFPHKKFHERKHLKQFDTYYFAGCAHAIRREVFDTVGLYPEDFFYGMEEYDLSYRTLDAGFRICYDSRVTVLHKESPEGRLPNPDKLRGMWVNKSMVAWKYLPKKYFYSTALLWSFEFLKKTNGNLNGWFRGWRQVAGIPDRAVRRPLTSETLRYIASTDARMHY